MDFSTCLAVHIGVSCCSLDPPLLVAHEARVHLQHEKSVRGDRPDDEERFDLLHAHSDDSKEKTRQ